MGPSNLLAFLRSTHTTWTAPLPSWPNPRWRSSCSSWPLTWSMTLCRWERETANMTGWTSGTAFPMVSDVSATRHYSATGSLPADCSSNDKKGEQRLQGSLEFFVTHNNFLGFPFTKDGLKKLQTGGLLSLEVETFSLEEDRRLSGYLGVDRKPIGDIVFHTKLSGKKVTQQTNPMTRQNSGARLTAPASWFCCATLAHYLTYLCLSYVS